MAKARPQPGCIPSDSAQLAEPRHGQWAHACWVSVSLAKAPSKRRASLFFLNNAGQMGELKVCCNLLHPLPPLRVPG